MQDSFTARFIELAAHLGLNYDFLNSGYEVQIWLDGMKMTLILVAVTLPLSLVFGFIFAAMLTSGKAWLAGPVRAYVELTRNTPTLVQLMCGFLVLNMLISNALGGAQNNPLTPFFWVVAVTGLHIAAFHAEALRGGIEAVPGTTIEAARAIGFLRDSALCGVSAGDPHSAALHHQQSRQSGEAHHGRLCNRRG